MARLLVCLILLLPVLTAWNPSVLADDAPAAPPSPALVELLQQAQQALDAKEHARAAGLLERAFADAGEPDAQWLYLAAASWQRADRPDDAARCLERLGTATSNWEPAWLELATFTALEQGRHREAAQWALRLAAAEPGQAASWRLLAKARLGNGDRAGAASALEAAVRLGDATPEDLRSLAELYLAAGALELGAAALERAAGDTPSVKDCDRLALVHVRTGDLDAALSWSARAQSLAPDADRLLDRGDWLREAGRDAQAAEAYAGAARLEPDNGRAWLRLGFAAYDAGDFRRARHAFAEAAALPASRKAATAALDALEAMLREDAPASAGDGS